MLKQITQFKSIIQGIESTFHFDANCPIEIAKQAIFEALKWIGQMEDNIKANLEAQKEQQPQAEQQTVTEEVPHVES